MALITRKITRTSQPQELVGVDWSNPFASSLVRAVDGRSLSDLVSNSMVTKNGSVAYSELNGSSFGATSSIQLLDAPCGAYTLFSLAYAYTGATGTLISRASGAANYDQNYGLLLSSGTTPQAGHKNASGGAYPYITSSIAASAGSLVAAASTFDGSTTRVYTNGVLGGSVAATAPYTSIIGVATQIGATDGTDRGAVYAGRGVKLCLIFNRALSASEIKSLSDNPWQLFAPIEETIWIPDAVSGGGTTTQVTASTGTADGSGYSATVNRQSAITSTLATATASGNKAAVNRHLDIAASIASATASGYPAGIQIGNDLTISAGQGTATASGYTANVNRQTIIAASVGTATASGFAASISNGAVIAASYGLASADGYQAQINLRREIAAGLASAGASGYGATVGFGVSAFNRSISRTGIIPFENRVGQILYETRTGIIPEEVYTASI